MRMRIVLPVIAAVAITAVAVISFARGAETSPAALAVADRPAQAKRSLADDSPFLPPLASVYKATFD